MEEQTQTCIEKLIPKAKRLDIPEELKEKVISMLEYLSKEEGRKLYLVQGDQSEFYLQISNGKLMQIAKNFDIYGSTMQRRRDIMLVENLPEIYIKYQEKIDESISIRKRF